MMNDGRLEKCVGIESYYIKRGTTTYKTKHIKHL